MNNDQIERACPVCGSLDYKYGRAAVAGGGHINAWFKKAAKGIFGKISGLESYEAAKIARICQGCGNVQIFIQTK